MMYAVWLFLLVFSFTGISACAQVSATDYGADRTGAADATAAIQQALNAAAERGEGSVRLPEGRFRVDGRLVIPAKVTLIGEYPGQGRERGTILLITGGKGQADGPSAIHLTGSSGLSGVAIVYPEQSPDAEEPTAYPWTITAGGDARITNLFLKNSYQGINLDGSHANLLQGIWGEPLKVGIHVDHVYDISRIENVHFWPYFTLGKRLRSWVQAHGVAFEFGRSDWQYIKNAFCYGYRTGFRFFTSKEIPERGWPGGATNGQFVGLGADCVGIGLDIEDSFNIGVSIVNSQFAPFGGTDTRAVLLRKGNTGNISLVNCSFWAVTEALAEVHDGALSLTACNVHEWAVTKKQMPAFLQTGGRLAVNGCTFNAGGLVADLQGAESRALFTANMGVPGMRVVNRIGTRALVQMNNPRWRVDRR